MSECTVISGGVTGIISIFANITMYHSTMNPSDLVSLKYGEPRKWITNKHESGGKSWEEIATQPTSAPLDVFLATREEEDGWPAMDAETWKELVRQQEEIEKQIIELDAHSGQALVIDDASNNEVEVPHGPNSCWQLYKARLAENGFAEKTIGEIERATKKLLRRLSIDTRSIGPIKGLVIGNVQSGKTANMAALMAMAADWGWNMFVVLSGTIDNLRKQTQERLHDDLNSERCNLAWNCLEHLSTKSPIGSRAQDLHFEEGARQRYFTVSLKNSSRLKNLIQWMQKDKAKMKQMRIIIIDDEADQAGINTADVNSNERRKINRLICALVNGQNESSRPVEDKYMAMNYIGYTATPYANILNEASRESLYPRNFISTLSVSDEYFGPQQIFGVPEGPEGLDIVRRVPSDELDKIKLIHKGNSTEMPDTLADAICWFACCVAAMRHSGFRKPISMLVHTSQRVPHHENVSSVIEGWFNGSAPDSLMERCRQVWDSETEQFPLNEFREQYPNYGLLDSVGDYPPFDDIRDELQSLLSVKLKPIKMGEEGELEYHNGIHLCVDNSANNGISDENEYLRLVYPDKKHMPDPAPAFLVIGGATLSRGLTLEGLVSTFFLRTVKQADTLMQMGRWFGYRRGYELFPRLWITDNTKLQFEYLSILDQELREEIKMMEIKGLKPNEYAARVRNTPRLQLIRITAKNRMQSSMDAEMDYSGSFNQTYMFNDDKDILEGNLELTGRFIESLGAPRPRKACNPHSANATVWENVPIDTVENFLREFKFCGKLSVFNDLSPLLSWIRQISSEGKLKNWNVVLAGRKNATEDEMWKLANCSVAKVSRTRKNTANERYGIIDIGALRAPMDIVSDVDLDGQPDDVKALFSHIDERNVKMIRHEAGLGSTPQLLVYIVDKDSAPKKDSKSRKPLAAPCDIVGLCVNIPGGESGANYVAKVCIRLDNEFNDDGDIEEDDN